MNIEEPTLTREQVANLAGVGRVTLERAIAAGEIAPGGTGGGSTGKAALFSISATCRWMRDRAKAAAGDEDTAKGRKLMAEARLKELKLAAEEGKLVPADEVEARWTERVGALREALRAIPGMAVQAGLVAARDEVRVETMLRDALVAYARTVRGGQ
jgi:phage terminase Nu1 subunit (DNA packaging protein)